MARQFSTAYTFGFAGAVCLVCSIIVAGTAVGLKDRQELNKVLDRQKKVLAVTGLIADGEVLSDDEILERFEANIVPRLVDMQTGEYVEGDAANYDMLLAMKDPERSFAAPAGNSASVRRLPKHGLVYEFNRRDEVSQIVIPIQGKGLWSTLYGYIALDADGQTVTGLTFYEHGETPGLGGEVDNPRWQAGWRGRKIFNSDGVPQIEVIKGAAGPPSTDPHRVDGLSGATITGRGVSDALRFWLGQDAFLPYLARFNSDLVVEANAEDPQADQDEGAG